MSPPRRFWQLHISTVGLTLLAALICVVLNVVVRQTTKVADLPGVTLLQPYTFQGWPLEFKACYDDPDGNVDEQFAREPVDGSRVAVNVLLCAAMVAVIAVLFERYARRIKSLGVGPEL